MAILQERGTSLLFQTLSSQRQRKVTKNFANFASQSHVIINGTSQ